MEATSEENLEKLKEINAKNAVLLTFGNRYVFPKSKLKFLKEVLIQNFRQYILKATPLSGLEILVIF